MVYSQLLKIYCLWSGNRKPCTKFCRGRGRKSAGTTRWKSGQLLCVGWTAGYYGKNLNRALKAFPEFKFAEEQCQRIYNPNKVMKLNLTFSQLQIT
jgi:hypothetical protein